MNFDEVKLAIDRGKDGLNCGIPLRFDRVMECIPGIQQETYYCVGGELGTGKTSFVDDMFVSSPIDYLLNNETNVKLKIIYYSFEISKVAKLAKMIARKIYDDRGIYCDINYILSKGKNRISEEIYNIVMDTKDYFYHMEDVLEIRDVPENPTGISKHLRQFAEQNGKFNHESEFVVKYMPNNPNLIVVIIMDHVGLLRQEQGFSKKQTIDKMSEYLVYYRNKCRFSAVTVQQLNRSVSSATRFQIDRVEPQLSDFKESGVTQEDANIVLALFNPFRYAIESFHGYNTKIMREHFRSLHLLKNRDGAADKDVGLHYFTKIGKFNELPKSEELKTELDYKLILNSI